METSITKYDWKYCTERTAKRIEFKIIPAEKVVIPSILYKYYSVNQNGIDALVNGYIYATHPSQFNDLFDCYEELLIFDSPEVNRIFLIDFFGKEKAEQLIRENHENLPTFVQRNFREIFYRKLGVFSMTVHPDNILMWSYYSNNQGFSVGFDYAKFEFKHRGVFPVNYQDTIQSVSLKEASIELAALYQTNIKYSGWKHEDEWRLLIDAPGEDMISPNFEILKKSGGHNRKFHYPITAIKNIYLGNRFFSPEEISINDSDTLTINLKINFEQKCVLLNFLTENKIESAIAQRSNSFKNIHFRNGIFEKINNKQFKFTAQSS